MALAQKQTCRLMKQNRRHKYGCVPTVPTRYLSHMPKAHNGEKIPSSTNGAMKIEKTNDLIKNWPEDLNRRSPKEEING